MMPMKNIFLFLTIGFFSTNAFTQTINVEGSEKKPTTKSKSAPVKKESATNKGVDVWSQEAASPIFIVQNIATEKTRVYRRCTQSVSCPNELLFETDTLVGHATGSQKDPKVYMTRLGHYKIGKWIKFYEDRARRFPAWYKSDYPVVPRGTTDKDWLGSKYLPAPQLNAFRGTYGWFTAQLGPSGDEQVIHGTYGWGEDKGNFIAYFRNPLVSYIEDTFALGTTRVENQAVAYMRHLANTGSDVFRVYALEGYGDASLSRYSSHKTQSSGWDWVLTNRDAQKESPTIDKSVQIKNKYLHSETLEEGRFTIDRYPTGLGYSPTLFGIGVGAGTTGNTYQIKRKQFVGVFLVDEGRFVDYEHPKVDMLSVGGYPKQTLPAHLVSKGQYVLAEPVIQ